MDLLSEWRAEFAYRIRRLRRRPWLSGSVGAVVIAAVVLAVLGGPHGLKSATLHRWQSADFVAVPGERAGACAVAYPPWQQLLSADQWIVCARRGGYRCFLKRLHPLSFKHEPVRPSRFDANCRSALAVLRAAGILR